MVALTITISAALAIIAGVLVLISPRLVRWAVGLYLIAIGAISFLNLG